jgi:hypothetical protein
MERRLAAVLAADVAGYSRLMGADEEGTLAQFKTHRSELVDPKIDEYGGRIVKTTGDGLLVEFASVVDAMPCAIELQKGMAERNALVPENKRIQFRIGIYQGDIINAVFKTISGSSRQALNCRAAFRQHERRSGAEYFADGVSEDIITAIGERTVELQTSEKCPKTGLKHRSEGCASWAIAVLSDVRAIRECEERATKRADSARRDYCCSKRACRRAFSGSAAAAS